MSLKSNLTRGNRQMVSTRKDCLSRNLNTTYLLCVSVMMIFYISTNKTVTILLFKIHISIHLDAMHNVRKMFSTNSLVMQKTRKL